MTFCEPDLKGNGAKQIVLRPDLVALLSPLSCWEPPRAEEGSRVTLPGWALVRTALLSCPPAAVEDPGGTRGRTPGFCRQQSCCSLVGSQQLAVLLSSSSAGVPQTNNSSGDGGRSGGSTRRCPSDLHLLIEPEDPAEPYGDGSGSA